MNDQALETSAKALELEADNEAARELYEECKSEWDDDHTVEEDNPEKQRFGRLEKWLNDGGSKYDKLKIRFYNPIYRGVHAAKKIRVSDWIFLDFVIFNNLGLGRRRTLSRTKRTNHYTRDG